MRLAVAGPEVVWSAVAAGDLEPMHPLVLHVAFAVEDVAATHRRLLAAGAVSFSGPETTALGDQLAMLRDPFGLAVQLVRRKSPLVGEP